VKNISYAFHPCIEKYHIFDVFDNFRYGGSYGGFFSFISIHSNPRSEKELGRGLSQDDLSRPADPRGPGLNAKLIFRIDKNE